MKGQANRKATKTEMNALYTAFDIHRRAAILAAEWTAFDPFGAVVYTLRDFEDAAFDVRECVVNRKDYWDFTAELNHPLRPIKAGRDKYETFRNHLKGIEGAIRRLLCNEWIRKTINRDDNLTVSLDLLRESMAELKRNM